MDKKSTLIIAPTRIGNLEYNADLDYDGAFHSSVN